MGHMALWFHWKRSKGKISIVIWVILGKYWHIIHINSWCIQFMKWMSNFLLCLPMQLWSRRLPPWSIASKIKETWLHCKVFGGGCWNIQMLQKLHGTSWNTFMRMAHQPMEHVIQIQCHVGLSKLHAFLSILRNGLRKDWIKV